MSFYGSRALGRASFSAFGAAGRSIFGPFVFAGDWSSNDFNSISQFNSKVKPGLASENRQDLTWTPPSPALITQANNAWISWQSAADAGSPDASTYITNITNQMIALITTADSLTDVHDVVGNRPMSVDIQRYDTFNQIVKLMKTVATSQAAANAAVAALPATAIQPMVASPPMSSGTSSQGSSGLPNSGSGSTPPPAEDNTVLYLGLGVGGLVLLGGAYLLLTPKKAAAVSGYRRRRRSR